MIAQHDFWPVALPGGSSGKWTVYQATVSPEKAMMDSLKHCMAGFPEMSVSPGTYTVLARATTHGPEVMMSNTQFEYRTNIEFVGRAHGQVLVNGLGIGMLLRPLAARAEVERITVVEKDRDILQLIAPHYQDLIDAGKLRIIHGDAFKYVPDQYYDCIMHDIWPTTSTYNLTEMIALKRRYQHLMAGRIISQHCWAEEICWRMAGTVTTLKQLKRSMKND
jgi:spermidine synthase